MGAVVAQAAAGGRDAAAGLDVDGADLALVCASHNAEAGHLDVVRGLLAAAGLGPDDLRNTPDWPLDPDAAFGGGRTGTAPSR